MKEVLFFVAFAITAFVVQLNESIAQSQIYQFAEDGLRIKEFDPIADDQGNVAVMYVTPVNTTPGAFQTNFLFFSKLGTRKVKLPGRGKLYGAGYTENSFFFLVQLSNERSISMFEIDKEGKAFLRNHRISIDGEKTLCTFSDGGVIYIWTLPKNSNEVRIRVFAGAKDPVIFTYKISEGLFEELEEANSYRYVHDRFEQSLHELAGSRMVFLRNGSMWVTAFGKTPKEMDDPKKTLKFLELSLKEDAPGLRLQEIPVTHHDFLGVYPLRDTLYMFQAGADNFYLGVASLNTLQVVKKYSMKDDGIRLIQSRLYESTEGQIPDGTIKQPKDNQKMLKQLSKGSPFVYARKQGTSTNICFGSYTYPTVGGGGGGMANSMTHSTPYGSFTTSSPAMSPNLSSTSSNAIITFLYGILDSDLNLVRVDKAPESVFGNIEKFAQSQDFEEEISSKEICRSSLATYLIGFSKKKNSFTIWSFPNP